MSPVRTLRLLPPSAADPPRRPTVTGPVAPRRVHALLGPLREAGSAYARTLFAQGCPPAVVRENVRELASRAVAAEGWGGGAGARALAEALATCAVDAARAGEAACSR